MTESAGSFQSTGREPCDWSGIVEAPCLFASCPWACAHGSDAAWRGQDGSARPAKTVTHPEGVAPTVFGAFAMIGHEKSP